MTEQKMASKRFTVRKVEHVRLWLVYDRENMAYLSRFGVVIQYASEADARDEARKLNAES